MKKAILVMVLVMCTAAVHAETVQLKSFDEVMAALNTGEHVRAVFHYGRCKLMIGDEEHEAPDAVGGMAIETYEYFAPMVVRNKLAYVVTSESKLIYLPHLGYVYNYVKVKIAKDNSVKIIAQYLTPGTLEVKMDETFVTSVNDGTNDVQAAYFYKAR